MIDHYTGCMRGHWYYGDQEFNLAAVAKYCMFWSLSAGLLYTTPKECIRYFLEICGAPLTV